MLPLPLPLKKRGRPKGKVKPHKSANQERSSSGRFSAVRDDNSDKSPTNEQVSLYGVQIGVKEDPNEVQQRHFSQRFTSQRFSLAELLEMRSNQVADRLMHSPKRQRTSGEFADTPTDGMRHGGVHLQGRKNTSYITTQPTSCFPAGTPISKINEVFDWMAKKDYPCKIYDIKNDGNEVFVQSFDKFGNENIEATGINLSYKVYAPCKHFGEKAEYVSCRGNVDCHHCQCGCNGDIGDCGKKETRVWMWSHNVVNGTI